MRFRPLSARGHEDPRFDTLHEGFPEWMHESVIGWEEQFLTWSDYDGYSTYNESLLRVMQLALQIAPPLEWRSTRHAAQSLLARMALDQKLALDVIDFTLNHMGLGTKLPDEEKARRASHLNMYLRLGGSAWEARSASDPTKFALTRRELGPVADAIEQARSSSERAGAHLTRAWVLIAGRNPDPGGAYREAVRAVEAAAKPIVSPKDSDATLGKMIRAIRDKPSKWTFLFGAPERVAEMCAMLWSSQLDRHGTDDDTVPLNVSQDQADAAVYLALTLVRWFAGGAFAAAS